MKRKFGLFIIVFIFAVLLGGCSLPVQFSTQPTAEPPQSTQVGLPAAPEVASTVLQATISAFETRVANISQPTSASDSKQVVNTAQAPTATPAPIKAAAAAANPTATNAPAATNPPTATTAPTAVPAATQTPQSGVPVVYITPIATLNPNMYTYYPQPNPYYPQSYYYPNNPNNPYNIYNPYPNTFVPCNRATFIADMTVADNTNFAQGAKFTKTWRLRNDGTCTWTTGYSLIFDHGDGMGGATSTNLPAAVAPGGTIDLSVALTAPSSDGVYQGFWMLQDAGANHFGIGFNAAVAFWVKITVGTAYSYQGPYYYPNPYPYPYPYYYPPTPVYNPPTVTGNCQLVEVSPSMGSTFSAKNEFDVRWTIKNTGSSTWLATAVDYQYLSGTRFYKYNSLYDLPSNVASGNQTTIVVDAIAPASKGWYTMTWGIVQSGSQLCTMSSSIYVK